METAPESPTVYFLEMLDRRSLRPKLAPPGFDASLVTPPAPDLNRHFYQAVGRQWEWTDRCVWMDHDWQRYVERPALQTWVGTLDGQPVGYFEMESQADGNVEIAYLGLLPEYIGRGLGGALLTAAVQHAWSIPATRRVWLHTCTKDHAHALDNYCKRGFEVYKIDRSH